MQTQMSPYKVPQAKVHGSILPRLVWAVVLAGGDGTRLATLTRDNAGNQIPKQFWSLTGGNTLVHTALQRARQVASPERTCVVVAAKHRRHWSGALPTVAARNIIVQPRNCGTAIGILLATLHIARRDPFAHIVFLPADHYVQEEAILGVSMQETVASLSTPNIDMVLLGIEPDGIDCDLGYIVPAMRGIDGAQTVARFVEKPDALLAQSLLASGAVWNSFIFASNCQTLIKLMREHMPRVVSDMWAALESDSQERTGTGALQGLYRNLLNVDFSRTVLQEAHRNLQLVTAPACGWTDLGTPMRVAKVVGSLRNSTLVERSRREAANTVGLNLAVQCRRLGDMCLNAS